MKIIDLLNKIANGEEVPKKIAIQNKVLVYNEDEILNLQDCYYMNDEDATWKIWAYELNDEVEILDENEEKELPEKLHHCYMESENEEIKFIIQNINDLADKYNDLLDYLEKQRKGE